MPPCVPYTPGVLLTSSCVLCTTLCNTRTNIFLRVPQAHLGAAFALSTMAAAGLGNAMSDAVGIASGSAIEGAAERAGMAAPTMSAAAAAQPITGAVNYAAQVRTCV